MTIFKFFDIDHPVNEVNLARMEKFKTHNMRGRQHTTKYRLTLKMEIQTTGAANFLTLIDANELQYTFDQSTGQVGLFNDDGTATSHVINAAASRNGVEIAYYRFEDGPDQLATCRNIFVVLEAEYLFRESNLEYYVDSLHFRGTVGPVNIVVPYQTGGPVLQTVREQNPFYCRQTGMAVGTEVNQLPAIPFFAQIRYDKHSVSYETSKKPGRHQNISRTTRWNYYFESPVELLGVPLER